jgi:DNA-binding transcriptional ArsR family regulator
VSKKKTGVPRLLDDRLLKALADPIRAHAWNVLNQRPASPSEIAAELDVGVQRVDYHVQELKKLGVVEQLTERNVDGAKANIYRATARQFYRDEEWAEVPKSKRLGVAVSILGLISGDLNHAIAAGSLAEHADEHVSRMPMTIDAKGWEETAELLTESLEELLEIQTRSTERMAVSGEDALVTKVVMMHFVSPPGRTI